MSGRADEQSRREQRNKRDNAYQKSKGYVAQKRYREAHKGSHYEPKVRIPMRNKEKLAALLASEGVSLTQLLSNLVLEKYGIDLQESAEADTND